MANYFYTTLAKYYDKIYHYIDYKKQADFFAKVFKKFSKSKNKKILDVCCGTGTHAKLLSAKGFHVVGVDLSRQMLNEARKKNPKMKFLRCDMKNFRLKGKFGMVLCFFNSILFNKNSKEMCKALKNFYTHLDKGGLLVFDMVGKNFGGEKKAFLYSKHSLRISFTPWWFYGKKHNVLQSYIDFDVNGKKFHDHNLMGAFSFPEMKKFLREIGFRVFVLKKDFTKISLAKRFDERAIFVCRK